MIWKNVTPIAQTRIRRFDRPRLEDALVRSQPPDRISWVRGTSVVANVPRGMAAIEIRLEVETEKNDCPGNPMQAAKGSER